MAAVVTQAFDWGAASVNAPGESECGDKYVVEAFDQGVMVALIDALGHGREAAHAANVAAQTLSRHAREGPAALIGRCHAALRGTRGAAVSIAAFDVTRRAMAWLAVGNVAGMLVNADPRSSQRRRELVRYAGVVGDRLPELSPWVMPVAAGDTLILTTDGISDYTRNVPPAAFEPQWLADRILGGFVKRTDDAAVLVVRLNGEH